MKIVDDYVSYYLGCEVADDTYKMMCAVCAHMLEGGITEQEVTSFLESKESAEDVRFDTIPQSMWEDSFIDKDAFYVHPELRLMAPAPRFNSSTGAVERTPFFLEMKIRYTVKDLIAYYKKTVQPIESLYDEKRTIGSFEFLFNKYRSIDVGTTIDFLLKLIDVARNKHIEAIQLSNYEQEAYELHRVGTMNGKGEIVWRV